MKAEIKVIKPELPKGGSTIQGMGEAFAPHEFSGASSLSIPLPITAGRGMTPSLSLNYSSGNANSAFGMGWDLSLMSISRQTSKGVPQYNNQLPNTEADEKDTFLLTGVDYLVEQLESTSLLPHPTKTQGYTIKRYMPRVESDFSLIDHYISTEDTTNQFWKVTTAANVTYIFGKSPDARIFDPNDHSKIFKWILEEAYDDRGNHCIYQYLKENDQGLSDTQKSTHRDCVSNAYLSKVKYGNQQPMINGALVLQQTQIALEDVTWNFELHFDYGQYNTEISNSTPYTLPENGQWSIRQDPFSTYDAGFEIRTWRLCQQVLMFHRFESLNQGVPVLTDILSLQHLSSQYFSFVVAAQLTGSVLKASGVYERKSMPQVELSYTPFQPLETNYQPHAFEVLTQDTLWDYRLVDLYSEGIPGLLRADGETVYYHQPQLPQNEGLKYDKNVALDFPSGRSIAGAHTLADVTGNGKMDVVLTAPDQSGFFEMKNDQSWAGFVPFESFPLNYHNSHNAQADLTGDGLADLVLVTTDGLQYNASKRAKGYATTQTTKQVADQALPLSHNPSQTNLTTFADFLGAGSAQRVQIKNQSVTCWPGLGYGQFGKGVTLHHAPDFGKDFSTDRLFLADIDGSGLTDLAYVYPDHVAIYLNQSGNAFAETPIKITLPETWNPLDKIEFADVRGNGTSCLVFTKMAPAPKQWFYDFNQTPLATNEADEVVHPQKPHLLQTIKNNLGASTTIKYASSTYFYLKDKAENKPWVTHLPFPVNVIASITNSDDISDTSTTSTYQYSHGYYDGFEREFRGFGFVGRTDAHSFKHTTPSAHQTADEAAYAQAPLETKTWYHTGAYLEASSLLKAYQNEYWQGDTSFEIPETELSPPTMNDFAKRGAHRALHGTVLRTEVYGRDHSPWQEAPYTVSETQFKVIQIQKKNKYCVFRLESQESISFDYERNAKDPMVSHSFTLATDDYGHVLESTQVSYGRSASNEAVETTRNQQLKTWVTYAVNTIKNPKHFEGGWLLGVPIEDQQFEIQNIEPNKAPYFTLAGIKSKIADARKVSDDHTLLAWQRSYYFSAEEQKELALKTLALPLLHHRTEHVVFDKAGLKKIEGLPDDYADLLTGNSDTRIAYGGYIVFDEASDPTTGLKPSEYFWNPGAAQQYGNAANFFLPNAFFDPFQYNNIKYNSTTSGEDDTIKTQYEYDAYQLMVTRVTDPKGNRISIDEIDYMHLGAVRITDANNNSSSVITDPLGMVIATAITGNQGDETVGFSLKGYNADPKPTIHPSDRVQDIFNHPDVYLQQAATFFYYDLDAWKDRGIPAHSVHINHTDYTEINHEPSSQNQVQKAINFSDGFGRPLQAKAWLNTRQDVGFWDGTAVKTETADECWLTSGAIVYNNKGNAIKQYEPFYAKGWTYQNEEALNQVGYASILFYDALDRSQMVQSPEGFFTKTLFGALTTTNDIPSVGAGYLNTKLYGTLGKEHYNPEGETQVSALRYAFEPNPWSTLHYDANDCLDMSEGIYTPTETTDVDTVSYNKAKAFANTPHIAKAGSNGKVVETRQLNVKQSTAEQLLVKEVEQGINYSTYNIYGQALTQTDQRLYKNGATNFHTTYVMGTAVKVVSADAGTSWAFQDVVGHPFYHKNSRGFEEFTYYDELLRPIELMVKGIDKASLVGNQVKLMSYVDTAGKSTDELKAWQDANMIGKALINFDESGLHIASCSSVLGAPICARQWIKSSYKEATNWLDFPATELKDLIDSLKGCYSREALHQLLLPAGIGGKMLANNFTTSGTHNAIGQVLSSTDADGNTEQPHYDSLNRITAIPVEAGDAAKVAGATQTPGTQQIDYNAKGQQTKEIANNGVATSHSYDPYNFRLTAIKSTRESDGKVLQDLVYHHDPVGNVCSVTNNAIPTVFFNHQKVEARAEYTYSSLYQLINATGREQAGMWADTQNKQGKNYGVYARFAGQKENNLALQNYSQAFIYDAGGNLVTQKQTGAVSRSTTIATNNNQIISSVVGSTALPNNQYAYDTCGNMTTLSGTAGVTWDYRNYMASAIKIERPEGTDDTEYYIYDSSGNRVRKISKQLGSNGNTTIHEVLYAGGIEIRQKGAIANGSTTINYTDTWHSVKLMQGRAISCIWRYWLKGTTGESSKSQLRYQLSDLLDSTNYEVDERGQTITYQEFYPYGGTSIITGKNATEVKNKHYQYSGKEKDSTGLYYYGQRYYAPWLGRWTSTDPAGTIDGLNIYAFVEGNPVTGVDVGGMGKLKGGTKVDKGHPPQKRDASKRISKKEPENKIEVQPKRAATGKKTVPVADQANETKLIVQQSHGNLMGTPGRRNMITVPQGITVTVVAPEGALTSDTVTKKIYKNKRDKNYKVNSSGYGSFITSPFLRGKIRDKLRAAANKEIEANKNRRRQASTKRKRLKDFDNAVKKYGSKSSLQALPSGSGADKKFFDSIEDQELDKVIKEDDFKTQFLADSFQTKSGGESIQDIKLSELNGDNKVFFPPNNSSDLTNIWASNELMEAARTTAGITGEQNPASVTADQHKSLKDLLAHYASKEGQYHIYLAICSAGFGYKYSGLIIQSHR